MSCLRRLRVIPLARQCPAARQGQQESLKALRELVEKLRANGWECFSRGLQWYALRFRRRA